MINKNSKFLLLLLFLLIIAVPISFAEDNLTDNSFDDAYAVAVDSVDNISAGNDDEILRADDVYFDASASSDGTGSMASPYKTVSSSRIGTNNHFAPGTYTLTSGISSMFSFSSSEMTFTGTDRDNTIITFTGSDNFITTSSSISFSGITLKGVNIVSTGGSVSAVNTVFDSGVAKEETEADNYKHGNSYGGAIKQSISSTGFDWGSIFGGQSSVSGMTFDNCIFRNNYAAYGGAIYAEKGTVTITNSKFENNHADNCGGAIAAMNGVKLTVTDCEFTNDYSSYDAGGAIYLFNSSNADIRNTEFNSCSASLGSSIACLDAGAKVTSSTFKKNKAKFEGGAIYALYGNLTVDSSDFYENTAIFGGAIYADNLTFFTVNGGTFEGNIANGSAGAIFAFANKLNSISSTFKSNSASEYNDVYQTDKIELNLGSDDYEMIQYQSSYTGTLPSKYDLRNQNAVTPVKDQGQSGNCWAFASIATLESAIYKATGKQVILSEGNLKNLANRFSDIGWDYETNNGGMYPFVFGYLTSWAGPVLNSLDPTDDWDVIAPIINSAVHVQNILYLQRTSFTDNNAIKQAIMQYGAVASEIYWSSSYIKGSYDYYYDGDSARNHAICVVGWDDSRTISGAPGSGAWIIKNSYGSHRGDGGYYYVSYYDKSLFRVYDESYNSFAIIFNDTVRYNKNYQYDAAFTDYFITGNKEMWYKNTFTSTGNDILTAFSTYFRRVTTWNAEIYVNNELKTTQNGKSNFGYYTFNLDNPIPLKAGDNFTVSLKITCNANADIPISEAGLPYTIVKEYFKPGVSFFSTDGVNWNDFYGYTATWGSGETGHNYFNQVACIKAFTTEGAKQILNTTIEIINVNSSGVSVKVTDQDGGKVNMGNVEIIIDGNKLVSSVSDSQASINSYLKPGSHNIVANYISNQYYNASTTSKTEILPKEKLNIIIEADNIVYGEDLNVKIILTNTVAETVAVQFTCEINSRKYSSSEFKVVNLNPGDYDITVNIPESSEYLSNTLIKTVTVNKITPTLQLEVSDVNIGDDIIIKAVLCEKLTGSVNIRVDEKDYVLNIADGEGTITLENTLSYGSYSVYGEFLETQYYSKASANSIFLVLKITPEITVFSETICEGQTAVVKVFVPSDISQTLKLKIGSDEYTSSAVNSIVEFSISNLNIGSHDYTVSFDGNDKYNQVSVKDSIEVVEKAKENVQLKVNSEVSDKSVTITVILPEDATGSIILKMNSQTLTNNLQNGRTVFTVNDLAEGEYSYIITFNGDTRYNSAIVQKSFKIQKATVDSTIIAENSIRAYKSGYDYQSTFTDKYGNLLDSAVVIFIVNGNEYEIKTSKYGVAKLNENFSPGVFNITIINPLTGENTTRTMKIVKRITENKNIKMDYTDGSKFRVLIYADNGKVAGAGEIVTFKIGNTVKKVATDANGYASFKITYAPKTYTVTTEYRGVKVSNKIYVKQILKAKSITKKKAKKIKFSATLKYSNGKAIKGKKITFKIKGKKYTAKTNKKGVATITLKNLKAGKYKITSAYLKTTISNTIKIKK